MNSEIVITRNMLREAIGLFDELTPDMEVSRLTPDDLKVDSPFDHHFYCSFIISDENYSLCLPDVLHSHFVPSIREMAHSVRHIKMLAVRPLQLPHQNCGVRAFNFPAARIPFRCTMQYDIVRQGTVIIVDFLGRHIGNHYRTIINGPLHRHQMPFRDEPGDGHEFDYLYVPLERKAYGDWVYENEDDEEGEYVRLPDLEEDVEDSSLHHYRVNGAYCYYRGETLERESNR